MRAEYADNDAITDDMASQAYTEQFAFEVFDRADNAVRANRVTGYDIIDPTVNRIIITVGPDRSPTPFKPP